MSAVVKTPKAKSWLHGCDTRWALSCRPWYSSPSPSHPVQHEIPAKRFSSWSYLLLLLLFLFFLLFFFWGHDRTKANIFSHLDNESPVTNPFYPLWFWFSTQPSSHVIQEKSDYITSLIKTLIKTTTASIVFLKTKLLHMAWRALHCVLLFTVSATPHPASQFLSASSSLACSQPLICTATGLSLMLPLQPRASCLCLFSPS